MYRLTSMNEQVPRTGSPTATTKRSGARAASGAALAIGLMSIAGLSTAQIALTPLSTYETGVFDASAAEIATYDAGSQRIFFTNADANTVVALDVSDPSLPVEEFTIDMSTYGGGVNSVVVVPGGIAVAVEANVKTDAGSVVFFDVDGNLLSQLTLGALPDMVTVTPDGTKVLVANEGEPDDTYTIDPNGSISIIDITGGLASLTPADVTTLDFTAFTPATLPGVRIFGPGATAAQDLEPEYIAVSEDSQTAWAVCQENNAVVRIDLATNSIVSITGLGLKDHSLTGNGLDASNQDAGINIQNWPVFGVYMPDAIASYNVGGTDYVVYANEGDAREWGPYEEPRRIGSGSYVLDPTVFPNAATLKQNANLGRLNATIASGDTDNDGDYDEIHVFGARSFTIRDAAGNIVFDSGDQFEQITAAQFPADFNSNNDDNGSFDSRSDDKGPEPEAVTIGTIGTQTYAFIGLERIGGIMVYDVTNPAAPVFVEYVNNRDFAGDAALGTAGDLGVEGLTFVPAADSPNGMPLLIASQEVSGTVTIYEIEDLANPTFTLQLLHASDLEGGVDAIGRAPKFAAITDKLEDTYANTVILSAGDNYIPGPFFNAASDGSIQTILRDVFQDFYNEPGLTNLRSSQGIVDIAIMNLIGFDASCFGNHEFDATTAVVGELLRQNQNSSPIPPTVSSIRWFGTQFPYLSANLDFTSDPNLASAFTSNLQLNTEFRNLPTDLANWTSRKKIAPYTLIERNGELIGVVGATTQLLQQLSSPGNTTVIGPTTNDMPALANILNPLIQDLINAGANKIILVSHLQQLALEQTLIGLLNDVDIVVAGGSDAILANADDRLNPGDTPDANYPVVTTNANGDPAVIVSTDGEYSYVGRLVVRFDAAGILQTSSLVEAINGPFVTDDQMVGDLWGAEDPYATNNKAELVQRLTQGVEAVVVAKDGNVFGKSEVFLDGRRERVRTQETNNGNISSDANLWVAKFYDPVTSLSLKNGGGIRAAIGEVVETSPGIYEFLPTQPNPASGKDSLEVSQLDIENCLRFNNQLSLVTLDAAGVRAILEHGVSATAPGSTPGQFPQIAGMRFSFDPTRPAGDRVRSAVVVDDLGNKVDTLVKDGLVFGDPTRTFRMVTLNFLAGGGDGYPFNTLGTNRVDLNTLPDALPAPVASFTNAGSEQDALAEYLAAFHATTPYAEAETGTDLDERIQILNERLDGIFPPVFDQNLVLELRTDANGAETNWELRQLAGDLLLQNGGGNYPNNTVVIENTVLPTGTYRLVVNDAGNDGIAGGGYVLRDANGQRIIDNEGNGGNFTGSSSMATGFGFDLPVGPVGVFPTWCDREDLASTATIRCESYGPVSAEFGVNDANSGYQWRFFDPNGGYIRYIFVSHANPSAPGQTPGPGRATFLRLNSMATLPLPQGVLLNMQVRPRVNGVYGNFGPVCHLVVDDAAAACPTTRLLDDPNSSLFSCGVSRQFNAGDVIAANPVPGANRYQWRFEQVGDAFVRQIAKPGYVLVLNWGTLPLTAGATYDVTVRVSFDNGANWCPFGDACELSIVDQPSVAFRETGAAGPSSFELWPNPLRDDVLHIRWDGLPEAHQDVRIDLVDLHGKLVYTEEIGHSGTLLDLAIDLNGKLVPGMYLMTLQVNGERQTRRLVRQ